jgi:hypothetical protein
MSTPKVELVNQALRLIGAEAITSFDEQTDLAATCSSLFDDTVRALLAAYPWRFTLVKAQLSRLTDAPPNEWTYQHALMPDQLVLRQLFPSATVGARPVADYEVFGARVYSDQPELWADYQVERDPAVWPPYFRNLARHALAAVLAIPVAESAERADFYDRKAHGSPSEGRTGGLMGEARRLDAQQQPAQRMEDFPLLVARHGGGI